MLLACTHPAAESRDPEVAVTSGVEIGAAGTAVRTRLAYDAGWAQIGAVAAVEPGADRPLLVVTGLQLPSALIGPVRLSGAWRSWRARSVTMPQPAYTVSEPGCLPATGINPGRLRGVQLEPLPGVALAGFLEPGAAPAGGSETPVVVAVVAAGEPLPAFSVEAYTAVRTESAPAVSTRWLLAAPPFPGGELALAGTRVRMAAGAGEMAGSVNVSLGPRLPPALHGRLSVRAPVLFGDLAAAVAVAGREFRSLAGEAPSAPLAWAVRLSGTGRPRQWRAGYRFAVRGEAPAAALLAARAGAAEPPSVELAVTPAVPLGALTVSGEGAVTAGTAGAVPTLALQVRARPGSVSVRWRGARAGDTLQVRAAAEASAVAVEAGWRVANEEITTQLAVEVRLPRGRLRIAAAGLGEPMPDGPRLTVTISVES